MKNAFDSLSELSVRIFAAKRCLLMVDFDGTLSRLAKTPIHAFLPQKNRKILQKLNRIIRVAVVSGRGLSDIKRKVGINGIIYAGNHGLEWQINGKIDKIKIPVSMARAMIFVRHSLGKLIKKYKGILLENKGLTLSIHYRLVKKHLAKKLFKEILSIIFSFQKKQLLKIVSGKKVWEIRPTLVWNKGSWVRFLKQKIAKQSLPIYIGDDATDEDAFKAFKTGITIRVGNNEKSHAIYYCRDTKQVLGFFKWLLIELSNKKYE